MKSTHLLTLTLGGMLCLGCDNKSSGEEMEITPPAGNTTNDSEGGAPSDSNGDSNSAGNSSESNDGDNQEDGADNEGEGEGSDPSNGSGEGEEETGSDEEGIFVSSEGGGEEICDPWTQDCPEGEKCVPFTSGAGGSWDSNKCVPVKGTAGPGDSCTYEGEITSEDDCDEASWCWTAAGGNAEGVCRAFCTGSAEDPKCEDGLDCRSFNNNAINLCIESCDPLAQNCPEGQACYMVNPPREFICAFPFEEPSAAGEACSGSANACQPGTTCTPAAVVPGCADAHSCCSPFCDTEDEANEACANLEGTQCISVYGEGSAPPQFARVGVCVIPEG